MGHHTEEGWQHQQKKHGKLQSKEKMLNNEKDKEKGKGGQSWHSREKKLVRELQKRPRAWESLRRLLTNATLSWRWRQGWRRQPNSDEDSNDDCIDCTNDEDADHSDDENEEDASDCELDAERC